MGATPLFQFPGSATAPSLSLPLLLANHQINFYQNPFPCTIKFSNGTLCRSSGYGGRGDWPRWDSNAEKTVRDERFRFNLDDDFVTGGEDNGDNGFGFRSGAKKRVWWSGDSMDMDVDEHGAGVSEESFDTSWIFKVLNAFGWMLPAIGISMLLGTGPNAFFMALVLPFAQSAVSLAAGTLWGRRSSGSPKPKRRIKKKPFATAASDIGVSKEKEDIKSGKVSENYESWGASNDISTKTRNNRGHSFGGWEELDERMGSYNVPERTPTRNVNKPRQQKKGKLSRRVRSRDTPLLLRLLIAIFPFLGSWTKL
ncbi:hypothetical protein U1Q18_025831 [Sarracenia purpurea var. burkii]